MQPSRSRKASLQSGLPEPEQHPATSRKLPSSLWQVEQQGVRCLACVRRCLLHRDSLGFCSAIVNWQDQLYSTAYGVVSEAYVAPIENKPVYHYRPGTRTLSLGQLGCNLRCSFCQNWEVAFRDARHGGGLSTPNLLPEQAITLALQQKCEGIAWTFNEPSITPMYVYDTARLAHAAGLYTVFVTNGLITREALQLLGPYIDVYRVDVKSIERSFYKEVANTARISDILPTARDAQQTFGIHIETVTNLMPGLNDSTDHLERLTARIIDYLGAATPWHITTYTPYAHMMHIPTTPATTLMHARDIAQRAGLQFIYTDNIAAPSTAHTFCPNCGVLVIERHMQHVIRHSLKDDGNCAQCGVALGIVVGAVLSSQERGDIA
jgi:pyruvate formate lyase activating enzyme